MAVRRLFPLEDAMNIIDRGIQLYLAGVPTGITYVNGKGITVTLDATANLLNGSDANGSIFYTGTTMQMVLPMLLRFSTATSISVQLSTAFSDPNNPTLLPPDTGSLRWTHIQLQAQDDLTSAHKVLDETNGYLVFTPGSSGIYPVVAMTTSGRLGDMFRLTAHANAGSLSANDYIIAWARA